MRTGSRSSWSEAYRPSWAIAQWLKFTCKPNILAGIRIIGLTGAGAQRKMGRINTRMPGLLFRGGVWHIDKVIYGTRVCESTVTSDLREAEALLIRRLQVARATRLFGARQEHTFREAATKYLEEHRYQRSLERDARGLAALDAFIGESPLRRVHHGTLQLFVRSRLDAGISPGTINRDLAVVRRILNLCARLWRDTSDRSWLETPPLIQMQRHPNKRPPYPLSIKEEQLLFSELAGHLAKMALKWHMTD